MKALIVFLLIFLVNFRCLAKEYSWIGFDDDGNFTANAVVERSENCPILQIDGVEFVFEKKYTNVMPEVKKCFLSFSRKSSNVKIGSLFIKLPEKNIKKIGIIGDTGCNENKCKNNNKWPFEKLANNLSKHKLDLVVHLGDVIYMKKNIISKHDIGRPYGWKHWYFEFFSPMEQLLKKFPLIITRGNHELDKKNLCIGAGFFFKNNLSNDKCYLMESVQKIFFDNVSFLNIDSSNTSDFFVNKNLIKEYRKQIYEYNNDAKFGIAITHRPMLGFSHSYNMSLYTNKVIFNSMYNFDYKFNVLLAGHLHRFQIVKFSKYLPMQLVVGNGGGFLDSIKDVLSEERIYGLSPYTKNLSFQKIISKFGFVIISIDKKMIATVYDDNGVKLDEYVLQKEIF